MLGEIKRSESEEQKALFQWAEYLTNTYPELKLMFHIPNEGKRTYATASRMKAEGMKKGVPDIFLPSARGGRFGLFIEMKVGINKPTKEQKKFFEGLIKQGYSAAVCYSFDEAVAVITAYLAQPETKGQIL